MMVNMDMVWRWADGFGDAGVASATTWANRRDIAIRRIQFIEKRIERGGFPATRRSRDQNHAIRTRHALLQLLVQCLRKSQLPKTRAECGAIQNTQHDFAAIKYGQNGYAKINVAIVNTHAKPSVLR